MHIAFGIEALSSSYLQVASQLNVESIEQESLLFAIWWLTFSEGWDRSREVTIIKHCLGDDVPHLLDVGSGDLDLFRNYDVKFPLKYTGVEPNEYLRSASFADRLYSSIYEVPDSEGFTHIICLWVLHIAEDPESLYLECLKRCRIGSKILITIPTSDAELYEIINHSMSSSGLIVCGEPSKRLEEVRSIVTMPRKGFRVEEHTFANTISLADRPLERAFAIVDFVKWLTSSSTLTNTMKNILTSPQILGQLPARLTESGVTIEITRDK